MTCNSQKLQEKIFFISRVVEELRHDGTDHRSFCGPSIHSISIQIPVDPWNTREQACARFMKDAQGRVLKGKSIDLEDIRFHYRGSEGEESENPFFEGVGSSSDEQPDRPRRNQRDDNRQVFEFKEVPKNKRVLLIATKPRGRASGWWKQLKLTKERFRKPRVTTKVGGDNTGPIPKRVGSSDLKCFNCGEPGHDNDDYEEPLVFDDDQYEEEIMSEDVGVNLMYLEDGTLSRYKAHLVANSSTQLERIDVNETFSLVFKPGTLQTILNLAASRH
ncbi:reverse transcriptase domain-containing protein [Tanacetum coccineum]